MQTNEDDVAISVITNGREVKRGNSEKGIFRVANLKAGKYVVRAAKEGFDADFNEQPAEIQKGEDKRVSFQFRRKLQNASASIRLTPGSELLVDGNSLGVYAGGYSHRARPEGRVTHLPGTKGKTVPAKPKDDRTCSGAKRGARFAIDRLAGTGRDQESASGQHGDLYPSRRSGSSHFYRNAPGSARRRLQIHGRRGWVPSASRERACLLGFAPRDRSHAESRAASLEDRGLGQGRLGGKSGYAERTAAGFILFPKPLSYVQFTIHSQGGKNHAQWFLNYVNEKNYVRCEISDDGFQALRLFEGKGPEILARKKGVAVSQWYTIRILARSDGATVSLLKGTDWEVLGEVAATGLATTKFGFFVPEGQQLLVANFSGRAF